jgi:hypothetical protein
LDNHKDYPGLEMSIQLILALVFANIVWHSIPCDINQNETGQ